MFQEHNSPNVPLLPTSTTPEPKHASSPARPLKNILTFCRRRRFLLGLGTLVALIVIFLPSLRILWRDFGYLIRPLWDTPEGPFDIITHFPNSSPNQGGNESWCALHGWETRNERPLFVDAIPIATELDMLEIRMREYAGLVSVLVIVESNMTHAGTPKPLHFAENRARFDAIAENAGIRIVYDHVGAQFKPNLPVGSFDNERIQRGHISDLLSAERAAGRIPAGSLILETDLDEIISRDTLELLAACRTPEILHLNVKNYRYSFNFPLPDEGYWRPKAITVTGKENGIDYGHGRQPGPLKILARAGWHCSWCFATLDDIRAKMTGYIHNDRMTRKSLLEEKNLRRRVCAGQDPFGMWAEAFTFVDVLAQSAPIRPANAFIDVPFALQQNPERFRYLLDKGCERPDKR